MSPDGCTTLADIDRLSGGGLLDAWDMLSRQAGEQTRDVVAEINAALSAHYDSNRYGKWRRGDEPVPVAVQQFMRRDLLQYLLGDEVGEALSDILK